MTRAQTFANVWDAIEDSPDDAATVTMRSNVMIAIKDKVRSWNTTQAQATRRLGVTQPRLNDLLHGKINKFSLDTLMTLATRAGLKETSAPFVCFLDSDDLWNDDFLERHLAAHLNETYAVGFTACNARLIDGQGKLIAGCVYWFGKERASADRDRAFAPIDPALVPKVDVANNTAHWQTQTPYRLYTTRLVHWVWVSTSSMMFRRSLIDLVFPDDDEVFRLHMDFYVVVMAQMVAGSLLIDEALYAYRLHGRNGAADNPVLGGRLHLSSRNWGNTYTVMLNRMLADAPAREKLAQADGGEAPLQPLRKSVPRFTMRGLDGRAAAGVG